MSIKLSYIIPIYNAAKYLTATLDSILSQSYKDWTCVCVNDGSTKYYCRHNIGTSDKISVRMFDRTLVDMQLEQFVYDNFPNREDKIKALKWQRLFNIVYLCADYKIHQYEFSNEQQKHAFWILKKSYAALYKWETFKYYPAHALMLFSLSFRWFMLKSKWYVQYKRSHGGTFFYQ